MVVKKGDYSPPKGVVCHDNECRSFVPVGAIDGGKIVHWGPLLEDALHGVLCSFNLLFEGVMDGIHIKNTNGGVCGAKKGVWEDCYVLIVWVPFDFIVWSS